VPLKKNARYIHFEVHSWRRKRVRQYKKKSTTKKWKTTWSTRIKKTDFPKVQKVFKLPPFFRWQQKKNFFSYRCDRDWKDICLFAFNLCKASPIYGGIKVRICKIARPSCDGWSPGARWTIWNHIAFDIVLCAE